MSNYVKNFQELKWEPVFQQYVSKHRVTEKHIAFALDSMDKSG